MTREVDFLVTYRSRVGVVEVDGDTHRNRYAADQSRDRFLRDAGINLVERIVADTPTIPPPWTSSSSASSTG
jgi:very-short-patch-repair endonuclease